MSLADFVQDWGTVGYSGDVGSSDWGRVYTARAVDWGRGYTARAVEAARLDSDNPLHFDRTHPLEWTVDDRVITTMEAIEREFEMRREAFSKGFGVGWRKEAVPFEPNQSFDTAKLDAFLDEM